MSSESGLGSGGTISGDLTIAGDLVVEGGGSQTFSETVTDNISGNYAMSIINQHSSGLGLRVRAGASGNVNILALENSTQATMFSVQTDGDVSIKSTDASGANSGDGAVLTLIKNDGAAMGTNHILGEIIFQGAEDSSNNLITGARIAARNSHSGAWDASNNHTDLVFYTTTGNASQGERMRVTSTGDLQITDTTTSSSTEGGHIRLASNDGAVMASGHRLGVIEFAGAEDTSNTITEGARIQAVTDATWGGAEHGTHLEFYTADGSDAVTASFNMRLSSVGNLSLGTDNASGKLHVAQTASNSPAIFIDHNSSATTTVSNRSMHIDFDKASNTASGQTVAMSGLQIDMNNDSATDVGTTNLTGLDVNMTMGTSGTQSAVGLDVSVSGADTNYAAIFSGGNVGIGVAAPTYPLHVAISGSGQAYAQFTNSATGHTVSDGLNVGMNGNDAYIWSRESGNMFFGVGGATRMMLDSNSRVSLSNNDSNTSNTVFGKSAFNQGGDVGADYNVAIGESVMGTGTLSTATFNTAVGYFALTDITTGDNNTAIGASALGDLIEGTHNTAIGNSALSTLKGESGDSNVGHRNIAIGSLAMRSVESGTDNSATANDNIAIGYDALKGGDFVAENRALVGNIAIGSYALDATDDNAQTGALAIGFQALSALTTGQQNMAIGYNALAQHTTGGANMAIGNYAMSLTAGDSNEAPNSANNIFIGYYAGGGNWENDAESDENVGVGNYVMNAAMDGAFRNTAVGYDSLGSITTADDNTALGRHAGNAIDTGNSNVAIGSSAGAAITSGAANVIIGKSALAAANTVAAGVFIGSGAGEDIPTGQAISGTVSIGYESMKGSGSTNASAINNTAIGSEALKAITEGSNNTTLGANAGSAITTASGNSMVGFYAGAGNVTNGGCVFIGDEAGRYTDGGGNVAIGEHAFKSSGTATNNHGDFNVAIGHSAMTAVTTGDKNVAIGANALLTEDTGNWNTAVGFEALKDLNYDGNGQNVAVGSYAAANLDTGTNNVAIGHLALATATTETKTVAIGTNAGFSLLDSEKNVIIGEDAGYYLGSDAADDNVFIGYRAGYSGETDDANENTATDNVAIGSGAMAGNTGTATGNRFTAQQNVAIGKGALAAATTCNTNVVIGHWGGDSITSGNGNVIIGYNSDPSGATGSNQICIGNDTQGIADNYAVIGDGNITRLYASDDAGATFYGAGQSWSDKRMKENVKDIGLGLDFINKINPIQYTKKQPKDYEDSLKSKIYPKGSKRTVRTIEEVELNRIRPGFIAQDVLEVLEELNFSSNNSIVQIDEKTTQHSMDYSGIIIPLVKAVQELSSKVEELEAKLSK